jgi:hypothetical protein
MRRAERHPRCPACRPRSRATGRRHGVASGGDAARPDVLGPSIRAISGSRCTHEHTQISLWHIPARGTTGN